MELQLGLALPVDDPFTKKLDLVNGEGCGSSLSSDDDDENYGQKRKRDRLVEVAEEADSDSTGLPKTLPLLIWNREPIDDDDDDDSQDIHKNGVVGDPLVGWPPIKNFRKLTYGRRNYNVARPNDPVAADVNRGVGDGRDGDGRWRSSYLKVQMEGVLITRKINLSFLHHHQSYNALTHSLISLFGKGRDNIDAYKLTYQDKEGDWMLAGDVPWRVFIGSIQRLKLLKNY